MTDFAELEINLYPRDVESYIIEFRYSDPDDSAGRAPVRGVARFDLVALRAKSLDPKAYGQLLTAGLISDPEIRAFFDQVKATTQATGRILRMRLFIDPALPGLQNLRWETLTDPGDGSWLLTNEKILFSRFLSSTNWDRVNLRSKGDLRAVVFVANPQDLADGEYQVGDQTLAPVDVPGEIERARKSLGSLPITELASDPKKPGQASLNNLIDQLRRGVDILYLVAHGAVLSREPSGPYLWLEKPDGTAEITPGNGLVERIRDLPTNLRPRLVVLASCQSSGSGRTSDTQGAMAALGPQLAQAGVPAVIAMQGDVSMNTVAQFMPVFFQELLKDGQIDRAIAAARGAVRDRADSWLPVLFMRLRGGRLWYTPGFGEDRREFEKWPSLIYKIQNGQCTPILGPNLSDNLLGSQREIAQKWAEIYRYPMEPHERESLPQVAQFLTINQYEEAPYNELSNYLKLAIRTRHASELYEDELPEKATLDNMIDHIGGEFRKRNPNDPYSILAKMPLPVFITTNIHNLLAAALKDEGKDPQVVMCPWNDEIESMESIYDREPDYQPTEQRPLVYHLFGRMNLPESIVMTEDNYFDFLIGVTRNRDLIPSAVRRAMTDSALLFLGFQLDDWQFRVLYRSILSQQGGERRKKHPHIAAQIEPDEDRILEPERARAYLESYFQGSNINLYWGSAEDFLVQLLPRLTVEKV
ncbi:MAG: hypothetical protein H6Q38_35 [Chloroflexi bacterium]|nr:hypothetical protein [Chloroflexota bacterium]